MALSFSSSPAVEASSAAYRPRGAAETHETSSPSMDISKASNFERFVFDLLGHDAAAGARTKALFGEALARDGGFTITRDEFARIASFGFVSGKSLHADRLATIRSTWQRSRRLVDTHTADGLKVGRAHLEPGVPMIVLETAQPAKFAETIAEAFASETGPAPVPEVPAALRGIETLPRRCTVLPADVARVKQFIEAHAG